MRNAWAEVDLGAIRHNVGVVRAAVHPAQIWAVVKADGYGHGAVAVAVAALDAGATGLCVALVQEGVQLCEAGIEAPILVLSEQPESELELLVTHGLTATAYSAAGIAALATHADRAGVDNVAVHLKIDTGMHRVGAAPDDAVQLALRIIATPQLRLEGAFTHLAIADEPTAAANDRQLDLFDQVLDDLWLVGVRLAFIHAANSAAALGITRARFDLVRLGIAMYGIAPGPGVAESCDGLRPALTLKARVGFVRRASAGEGVSYGLRHTFERDTNVATIPIGYADGVPRRLFATGGAVLIGGRRCPIVGVVTMDQLMVDCGDAPVAVGDEVVLIGFQSGPDGDAQISVNEWAERLDTIGYEIVCGISQRIERRYECANSVKESNDETLAVQSLRPQTGLSDCD